MKRFLPLILVLLIGVGVYYYTNLDNHYHTLQNSHDFPIPNDATFEAESTKEKGFRWEQSTGTEVPLSYRLMIKKSGWKQVEINGHNVVYKKDGELINLTLAPNYIGILNRNK